VIANFVGIPDMVEFVGFRRIQNPDDTHAIVFTSQSTFGDLASFEFTMESFPALGTQTSQTVVSTNAIIMEL
jgi:hypothetical protein